MKYFAFALIALSAFIFTREYSRYANRMLFELDEMMRFVRHIRSAVADYLAPPAEWCRGFSSELLEASGFAEILGERGAGAAARALADKLSLDGKIKDGIISFFDGAGGGERLFESGEADKLLRLLEKERERLGEELPKNVKAAAALAAAVSLGLIILLI